MLPTLPVGAGGPHLVLGPGAPGGTLPVPLAYTSVSPSSGSPAGGTAITITGTGFVNGATVTVGGAAATSVVFVDSTSITAVTPAGAEGAQDIVITNPDSGSVTGSGAFTYAYTTLLLDTFTDTDGTAITAHTIAPTNVAGGNYTQEVSYGDGASIEGNFLSWIGDEAKVVKDVDNSVVIMTLDFIPGGGWASNAMAFYYLIATNAAGFDIGAGYRVALQWTGVGNTVDVYIAKNGVNKTIVNGAANWADNTTKTVQLKSIGGVISCWIDGAEVGNWTEDGVAPTGEGVMVYANAYYASCKMDNLKVEQ